LYDAVVANPKDNLQRLVFADRLYETAGNDKSNGDYKPFQEEWADFIQKQVARIDTTNQERLSSYIHGTIRLTCGMTYLFGESDIPLPSHKWNYGYPRIQEPKGYWYYAGYAQTQREGYYMFALRNGFVSELILDLRQLQAVQSIQKFAPITKIWLRRFSETDSQLPTVDITTHKGVTGFMIEWERRYGEVRLGFIPEPMRFFVPRAKYLNTKLNVVGNETQKFYDSISEFLGVDVCEAD
jgi:uncharacterized protein (TIGR02996 family)